MINVKKHLKIIFFVLSVLTCIVLTYYFAFSARLDHAYLHLFYLPIVLAGLWYPKWGMWTAFLLASNFLITHLLLNCSLLKTDLFCYAMFLFAAWGLSFLQKFNLEQKAEINDINKLIAVNPIPTLVINKDHIITHFNHACEVLTGLSAKDMVGTNNQWKFFYPEQRPILSDLIVDKASEEVISKYYGNSYRKWPFVKGGYHSEIFAPYAGEKGLWLNITSAPITDSKGEIIGAIETIIDVTKYKELEEREKFLNTRDRLTGLYNRAFFEEELRRLDQPEYLPLGIIVGDANGLKLYNDTFGHAEGDKYLKLISVVLKQECKNEGLVARVGGDEFTILLPNTNRERIIDMITRIKKRFRDMKVEPINPSISLGFALKTEEDEKIEQVYKQAEDNMYSNKVLEGKSFRSSIIASLRKILAERANETEEHCNRIKELSVQLGKRLGLYDDQLNQVGVLALLHDIGKVAIPDQILNKVGSLTKEEWKIMKKHSEIGYRIALSSPEIAPIAYGILTHHERWDGRGYPLGLKGKEIPLISRIVAIADAYDAMINHRSYHRALSKEEALREIKRCAGKQFDLEMVSVFIEMITNQEIDNKGCNIRD